MRVSDRRTVIALGLLGQLGQIHSLVPRLRVHDAQPALTAHHKPGAWLPRHGRSTRQRRWGAGGGRRWDAAAEQRTLVNVTVGALGSARARVPLDGSAAVQPQSPPAPPPHHTSRAAAGRGEAALGMNGRTGTQLAAHRRGRQTKRTPDTLRPPPPSLSPQDAGSRLPWLAAYSPQPAHANTPPAAARGGTRARQPPDEHAPSPCNRRGEGVEGGGGGLQRRRTPSNDQGRGGGTRRPQPLKPNGSRTPRGASPSHHGWNT